MSGIRGSIRNAAHVPRGFLLAVISRLRLPLTQPSEKELFLVVTRQFKNSTRQLRVVWHECSWPTAFSSECSASTGRYASVAITYPCEDRYPCRVIEQRGEVRSGNGCVSFTGIIAFSFVLVHGCDNIKVGRPTIYDQVGVLQSSDFGCNLCIGPSMSRAPIYVIACHLDALSRRRELPRQGNTMRFLLIDVR